MGDYITISRMLAGQPVLAAAKLVSLCEPRPRSIPPHTGGAAAECRRLVGIDEVAGGIVTRLEIVAEQAAEQG